MNASTIIALISCIFSTVSGIAAAISAILMHKSIKPNIEVKVNKENGQCVYLSYENTSFALATLKIINRSSVAGTIDEISIKYNDKDFFAEDIYIDFNPYPFEIKNLFSNKYERDTDRLRIKCPILVNGFSVIDGFILFPCFPAIQTDTIVVNLSYRDTKKYFKRTIRKIRFAHATATPIYNGQNKEN